MKPRHEDVTIFARKQRRWRPKYLKAPGYVGRCKTTRQRVARVERRRVKSELRP